MNETVQNILLVVHIIAVTLWLGANFSMGLAVNRTLGASNEINAWWITVQGLMGKTMKNAAFILLLLTGIGLVVNSDGLYEFKDMFVSIGFLVVIIGGALGGMVFAPGCRDAAKAYSEGDATAGKAASEKMGVVGMVESLLVVVTIVAMVFHWGS